MNTIHPRALVHPSARLGNAVTIGPDAVVDAEVELGDGCEVRARAVLTGATTVGKGTQIGYGAIIGAEPQDLSYRGAPSRTRIGEGCVIREYVTIHRGTQEGSETVVGNRCYLMTGAHVAHNCRLEDEVILVNNVLLAGHVEVGFKAFLGGAVVVHQHVRLGAYCMIRGQTRLGQDVPPYAMATDTNLLSGINRVGLRRAGFDHARRRRILEALRVLCSSGMSRTGALAELENNAAFAHPDIQLIIEFARQTRRGICRMGSSTEQEEE